MELPSWIDKEAWDSYVEMRKSIRKPIKTDRAIKLAIGKLEALLKQGYDPTSVLDQSTFNSWQGLFPVRSNETIQRSFGNTATNRREAELLEQRERLFGREGQAYP